MNECIGLGGKIEADRILGWEGGRGDGWGLGGGVEREERYHIHQVHNVRVGYSERKGQGPLALNTSNFPTQSMHSYIFFLFTFVVL